MARARLRDRHQESLRRKLQVLKAEQAVVATDNVETTVQPSSSREPKAGPSKSDDEELSDIEGFVVNLMFLNELTNKM